MLHIVTHRMKNRGSLLITLVVVFSCVFITPSSIKAIYEYDLEPMPDMEIIDTLENDFKTLTLNDLENIESARRPDPLDVKELREYVQNLITECKLQTNQFQIHNLEAKIKEQLAILKQVPILQSNIALLEEQVSKYTLVCVNQSEFNKEAVKLNSFLNNKSLMDEYALVKDKSLTCTFDIAQAISSDYKMFQSSYSLAKGYTDSIIARYNQLLTDDSSFTKDIDKLSERNTELGNLVSEVMETQSLTDLKLKTTYAEKLNIEEDLKIKYADLTQQTVLTEEEVEIAISEEGKNVALSLDDGNTWMQTQDIDGLFKFLSIIKSNSDQVSLIKNLKQEYNQKNLDLKLLLAKKLALNIILSVYSQEIERNTSKIDINNSLRSKISKTIGQHKVLAEERKNMDRTYQQASSILTSVKEECSRESEKQFATYKKTYEELQDDFKKHLDDTFKATLNQKEQAIMVDVAAYSSTEPHLVFTMASKLNTALQELSSCKESQELSIRTGSEIVNSYTTNGFNGLHFQVDSDPELAAKLKAIDNELRNEMPLSQVDSNFYYKQFSQNLAEQLNGEILKERTILLRPESPWTQQLTLKKVTTVVYTCENNTWSGRIERITHEVEKEPCKDLMTEPLSISDLEGTRSIPELLNPVFQNLLNEKGIKLYGSCQ